MANKRMVNVDGNTAASNVAYAFSEVAAIYPITPSSDMGEYADAWAAAKKKNIFGEPLEVIQMQSEAGAAGACHGSLSTGALTTTFTASQGLLLMIPNMFKIAGEMLPTVFHVTARSIAAQSLSIFGDHSDVMACRSTGFGFMASANVQEAQDLAAITHLVSLESKIPFIHFFDGFRTSHSIQKIEDVDFETLKSMFPMDALADFRARALNPDKPTLKVGAQNPDVYFQGRETVNKFYDAAPAIIKKYMALYAEKTGRAYQPYTYIGDPEADKIIIAMGSSTETIDETIRFLNARGEKVGALKVILYRPFSIKDFVDAIPKSVKKIAVLDRTKEPGALGEPLYMDTITALQGRNIQIIGGRYGLSSKEFTPSMVKAVYDHLDADGHHGFTVGINDDVTHLSIPIKEEIDTENKSVVRCKFWGYGSDGTVGANKNSIKIIGEGTDRFVQGYFQYDSNKSGGYTISHLRFGKEKIQSEYLLTHANFIALHRREYIGKYDILEGIVEGGTFLLNSNWKPEQIFEKFTKEMQDTIIKKKIKVYNVDASKIAKKVGLGGRINTVMQTAFFKLSGVLNEEEAIPMIKAYAEKTFKKKGMEIVQMNWDAIDASADAIEIVPVPESCEVCAPVQEVVPADSDAFARDIVDPVIRLKGDTVPVSKMSYDGSLPTTTKRLEKNGRAGKVAPWFDKLNPLDNIQREDIYFEYPGCCQGCGEVGYISMVTQLFGDRMIIANATGCTSIYGGTFPTTPYAVDSSGKGPSWGNSLFEDNAEYGFGMRLAVNQNRKLLHNALGRLASDTTSDKLKDLITRRLKDWSSVSREMKDISEEIKKEVADLAKDAKASEDVRLIEALKDNLVDRSIWIFGGDGWAYDIGFGGLDHVLANNKNVNILVMDTEVYSNTGGQASKATPRGAVAKFAAQGKQMGKKNLGLMMSTYGSCYVASINQSMDKEQCMKAFVEAEAFNGPSIIIAYAQCIAHGYDLRLGMQQAKKAADTGYWPMYRFNPANMDTEQPAFTWDAPEKTMEFGEYTDAENRYKMLSRAMPAEAERLHKLAKKDNARRINGLLNLKNS
jgi:pyruvate/2-oxoacid:ferredoxin oxidoreductase alpha subunit/pyruvate/2-oxoacid:ferredoxin oxidoreductase beta subunit/Pyruvate/2-oxoacid:ferredoxin oxidoreductase gamma subunit